MTRLCLKCGEQLIYNEKLQYMQCTSSLHIEPVDLITPQWWCQCPECGVMGLNYADQEARLQKFDENNMPVFSEGKPVFEEQPPKEIVCKACGMGYVKK